MSLRIATPDDVPHIEELLRLMSQEIGFGRVNDRKAHDAISNIVNRGQCCLALRSDKIVGSLGLDISEFWYSSDKMLKDRWFFIHPAHRADRNEAGENAGYARKLIAWAKTAADTARLPLVIEMASSIDTHVKLRWFRKRMDQFGGAFVHLPRAA